MEETAPIIYCIYHKADLDGLCSGAIVRRKFPEAILLAIDYGMEIDLEGIEEGSTIYLVGFALPMAQMHQLAKRSVLHWIDNDTNAIEAAGQFESNIQTAGESLAEGIGVCELTWRYLFDEMIPESVLSISRYTTDNWKDYEGCYAFQYSMRLYPCQPDDVEFWEEILTPGEVSEDYFLEHAGLGDILLRLKTTENSQLCFAGAVYVEWEGHAWCVLNQLNANSLTLESSFNEEIHAGMLTFGFGKGFWEVSLFSETVDVSEIAAKFGGKGNSNIAGFRCHQLPFILPQGDIDGEVTVVTDTTDDLIEEGNIVSG